MSLPLTPGPLTLSRCCLAQFPAAFRGRPSALAAFFLAVPRVVNQPRPISPVPPAQPALSLSCQGFTSARHHPADGTGQPGQAAPGHAGYSERHSLYTARIFGRCACRPNLRGIARAIWRTFEVLGQGQHNTLSVNNLQRFLSGPCRQPIVGHGLTVADNRTPAAVPEPPSHTWGTLAPAPG
jgi:hypothetical protein